jgi:nucleoid-associated protein YgaU
VSGDNLSKIGAKYGVTWKAIFDANRDIISDPDMIHPGQELKIP